MAALENPAVRRKTSYRLNESAILHGQVLFLDKHGTAKTKTHSLGMFQSDAVLEALVAGRDETWSWESLCKKAREAVPNASEEDADSYLLSLIRGEVLFPDWALAAIGPTYDAQLAANLDRLAETPALTSHINDLRGQLTQAPGLDADDHRAWWNDLMGTLARTKASVGLSSPSDGSQHDSQAEVDAGEDESRLDFQLVSHAPAEGALPKRLMQGALRVIDELDFLWSPPRTVPSDITSVVDRYSPSGEIPFLDFVRLLAPMGTSFFASRVNFPTLDDASFDEGRGSTKDGEESNRLTSWFIDKSLSCLADGRTVLEISGGDIAHLRAAATPTPAPSHIEVVSSLCDVDGKSTLWLDRATPTVGFLAGRFTVHEDQRALADQLRAMWTEIEATSETTHAELTWTGGNFGDLTNHAPLLRHQIVFQGRGSPDCVHIALSELVVRYTGGGLSLWSTRLGKRIAPKLLNAVNRNLINPIARLLMLFDQTQLWMFDPDLGKLNAAPRVTYKGFVLSPRRWTIPAWLRTAMRGDLKRAQQKALIERWLDTLDLPNLVGLGDDESLHVDIKHEEGRNALLDWLRKHGSGNIREVFGASEVSADRVNEIVWYADKAPSPKPTVARRPSFIDSQAFDCGSHWLYLRLIVPEIYHEETISRLIPEIILHDSLEGKVKNYHFVRYKEQHGPQLRVRLELESIRGSDALTHLLPLLRGENQAMRIADWSVENFRPEFTRYGGRESWSIVQEIFSADTRLAVSLMQDVVTNQQQGKLVLCAAQAIHALLAPVYGDLKNRERFLKALREAWEAELTKGEAEKRGRLTKIFNTHRAHFEDAIATIDAELSKEDLDETLEPVSSFARDIHQPLQRLKPALESHPRMLHDIIHMMCNRLFGTREREGILHSMNHRVTQSLLARTQKKPVAP